MRDPAVSKYFASMPGAERLFGLLMQKCAAEGDARYEVQAYGIGLGAPGHYTYAWLPPLPVKNRPAVYFVLALRLKRRIVSPRFVETVEPYPGRYVHHLTLSDPRQLDGELLSWLREARTMAHGTHQPPIGRLKVKSSASV